MALYDPLFLIETMYHPPRKGHVNHHDALACYQQLTILYWMFTYNDVDHVLVRNDNTTKVKALKEYSTYEDDTTKHQSLYDLMLKMAVRDSTIGKYDALAYTLKKHDLYNKFWDIMPPPSIPVKRVLENSDLMAHVISFLPTFLPRNDDELQHVYSPHVVSYATKDMHEAWVQHELTRPVSSAWGA